jgi:SAM-dependent methyltransferase
MQETAPDVATIVARTARSYDALPYASDPFAFTHPSRLGAIARLFALDAAPPAEARILELGCASGGNIIPIAARQPRATVLGIDLSAAQVAAGRARIAALGLTNIELRCGDFRECASAAEAPFDYIICHGVYAAELRRERDRRLEPVRAELRVADRDDHAQRARRLARPEHPHGLGRAAHPVRSARLGARRRQLAQRERDLPGIAGIQFRGERRCAGARWRAGDRRRPGEPRQRLVIPDEIRRRVLLDHVDLQRQRNG